MSALTHGLGVLARNLWPFAAIVLAWELWIRSNGYTRTVAPLPEDIGRELATDLGSYLAPLGYSLGLALAGLLIGAACGVLLGVLVWASPLASALLMPTAVLTRVVPMTAVLPIVARLLGYGESTILLVVAVFSFFPVFTLTISGLDRAPAEGVHLFTALGARRLDVLLRLRLPYAIPNIMVATRLSAPLAIAGVLLADYLMAGSGLGNVMREARSFHQPLREWTAALVATLVAVAIFAATRALEHLVRLRVT